jgi:hypothetical protein
MSSELESGWAIEELVWTLWTGNKEHIFKTVFLDIPSAATQLWSKQECKHLPQLQQNYARDIFNRNDKFSQNSVFCIYFILIQTI